MHTGGGNSRNCQIRPGCGTGAVERDGVPEEGQTHSLNSSTVLHWSREAAGGDRLPADPPGFLVQSFLFCCQELPASCQEPPPAINTIHNHAPAQHAPAHCDSASQQALPPQVLVHAPAVHIAARVLQLLVHLRVEPASVALLQGVWRLQKRSAKSGSGLCGVHFDGHAGKEWWVGHSQQSGMSTHHQHDLTPRPGNIGDSGGGAAAPHQLLTNPPVSSSTATARQRSA